MHGVLGHSIRLSTASTYILNLKEGIYESTIGYIYSGFKPSLISGCSFNRHVSPIYKILQEFGEEEEHDSVDCKFSPSSDVSERIDWYFILDWSILALFPAVRIGSD